ncbi:MAG: WecB/TagA/CpsF family glycosyltransferase [Chthoniobacterales bacterium]
MPVVPTTRPVLGIRFFVGTPGQAVEQMHRNGGLLVAPAGVIFGLLQHDASYRSAVVGADCALADSGLMVLLWRTLRGGRITRISGLRYLQSLCVSLAGSRSRRSLWVVPNAEAKRRAESWLREAGVAAAPEIYIAPMYQQLVADPELLALAESQRPDDIIIGVGAGPQEKLGAYLRDYASHRPAIHCIGGALGVLTGHQRAIPNWADRLYLGWLFRLVAQPRVFIPRLARAWRLPWLIARYGEKLPPARS